DRAVVVEHRQRERLQDHGLGESALHHHDGGTGEVHLALAVSPDVSGEAELREPFQGAFVDDLVVGEEIQFLGAEPETFEQLQEATGPGHDTVTPSLRQAAGEHLADRAAGGGPTVQGTLEHCQFIVVGEQCATVLAHAPELRSCPSSRCTPHQCTVVHSGYNTTRGRSPYHRPPSIPIWLVGKRVSVRWGHVED